MVDGVVLFDESNECGISQGLVLRDMAG